MDLPERAFKRRKDRKLTQEQVASGAGVSLRAYQGFESGKSSPQGGNLRAILAFLDIDPDGDDDAATTRTTWPADVQVFLDVMGAYLATFPDVERLDAIHNLTAQIFRTTRG
ncbi:MAG TPA: helix-turn-helix transcriptional regulator [Nocardioidaceae bacterium]|nr:helix-turn-helix transcriptional regulator [Nocardioidaceae bacterium]